MARKAHHSHDTQHAADDVIVVHGSDITVDRARDDVPRAEVKHRFGGVDAFAVLAGTLAALGALAVLLALASALGSTGLDRLGDTTLSVGAMVITAVVLVLAMLLGGYVAGRVARYEGARNGLLTGLLFVVAVIALGGLALAFDEVRDLGLPSWVDRDLGLVGVIIAAAALLLVLLAATAGGRLGARWHRRVDDLLLNTRPGGIGRPAGIQAAS